MRRLGECFADDLAQAAGEAGAKVEKPQESRFRTVRLGGSILGKRPIYDAYLTCDKVINVPIAKHHSLSGATLAFKNLMGILGGNRGQLHQDIHTSVADLGNFLRPTLTVMDAFRILRRNGPSGGNLADVEEKRTIIASIDPVAVDAWTGETIFGLAGERLRYLDDVLPPNVDCIYSNRYNLLEAIKRADLVIGAVLVLGVILGPIAEEAFMNTMISFSNDWTVFFTRPISGTIVALTIIVLLLPFVQRLLRSRLVAAQTEVR